MDIDYGHSNIRVGNTTGRGLVDISEISCLCMHGVKATGM